MRKLVLFDIDGTLMTSGAVARQAITEAMTEVFGTAGNVARTSFSGKTDPQIVYEIMTEAGVPEIAVRDGIPKSLNAYVSKLTDRLRTSDIQVLSGVRELLDRLTNEPDHFLVGLLTGNIDSGARVKLTHAGLLPYFDPPWIGAFGSDAMKRHDLPAVALQRVQDRFRRDFVQKDIVIIGDSPHDVTCGKHLNVRSIAVATGWHAMPELQKYEPDHAFADLSDLHAVFNAIAA